MSKIRRQIVHIPTFHDLNKKTPPFNPVFIWHKISNFSSNKKKPTFILSLMMKSTTLKTTDILLTSGATTRVNALFSMQVLKSLVLLIKAFLLLLLAPFQRRTTNNNDEKHEHQRKVSPTVLRVPAVMVPRRSNNNVSSVSVVARVVDVATRRALAIKRVVQEDKMCVREVFMFGTTRGDTLFTQSWMPVDVKIKGFVVLLHGLNEHSGRYSDFAKKLTANGYKVFGMDWIGHGGSDGLHAYVHSLDDAVNDLKEFLQKVLRENSGLPCFCFGHSTGAAIILKTILDPRFETLIEGVALTSPAIGVQPSHPIFGMLAPIFSFLLPRYQFGAANKMGMPVSRDPEALLAKYSDPLVYTGSIRVRTGSEILRISSYLLHHLSRISVPFLVLHGTADTVTDPLASLKLYEEAASTEKSIKLYEGFLHDLLFEPEREAIAAHIIEWLNSRVNG